MEIHIKIKRRGEPAKGICGQRKVKRPLLFATIEGEATCKRCLKVAAK